MIMRTKCMEPLLEERKIEKVSITKPQRLGTKDKSVCSYNQMEIPKSPIHAMEFLSRSWSPSTSDFQQIFSANNPLLPCNTNELVDEDFKCADGTHKESLKQDKIQMDFRQPKTWLRGGSLTSILRLWKQNKKEEKRLQTAQLHAALSLTQLAAAIAGISSSVSKGEISPFQNEKTDITSQDIGSVLSSAAALVTNVCAEAAESLGAKTVQIRAAVDSGMAIQTPMDMIAVTATAATCLRGAALLKSRAMAVPRIQEMLNISAEICTVMPSGRKECIRVSIYLKRDHLMFGFKKKYLRGALTSAKEYQVTNVTEERMEHQGNTLLCLKTKNGIVKLIFEDEIQSQIWTSTILNLLELRNPCLSQS